MMKMPVLEDLSRQKAALLKRKSVLLKQLERCMAETEEIDRKISVIESCELEYDLHKSIELIAAERRIPNALQAV
ncbi:MAG TPA: hypothetical protein PLY52_09495 [Methanothrix sp.]|jgi:hypothetical protein|nr:hypothetical protein [Methanothrix sp.]MDI9416973.1 hypothetical protein [Euryarchaeota archaeon]HON36524.1 hypothetical protein [Methanothrix sp.]HRU75524.1 hypothetical protein [Methanothrix sp.]